MQLEVVQGYPPNYSDIQLVLGHNPTAVYTYSGCVYNPAGGELSPDILEHEAVHVRQQGDNPQAWWNNYLMDPAFRLLMEQEAYGLQYAYAKRQGVRGKLLQWALENMALALSGDSYGRLCVYGEAVSAIRNYQT